MGGLLCCNKESLNADMGGAILQIVTLCWLYTSLIYIDFETE